MRTAARALFTSVLVLTLLALPLLPEQALPPMTVVESTVPVAFAAGEDDGAWVSAPLEGEPTIVGLTWADADDAPAATEVRVATDGVWGEWQEVPVDDEHGPDPGSDEAEGARGGTSPIVVAGADAVQFRATGDSAPQEVTAELIEVDDPDGRRRVEGRAAQADAAPARPSIHGRDDWNGDSCVRRSAREVDYAKRVAVMFVHHTAGHTSYSRSDVPAIIRGICSYHVNARGWDDIGYNTLVDRFGGIWQGRSGRLARGVQGAHTGGFNSWSHGVALIGDHTRQGVTAVARGSLVEYGAWYLDQHNVDPRRRYTVESAGSSRWADGVDVRFDAVNGHSAASYTACPGRYCLSLLGQFMVDMDARGGFKTYGGWTRQREHRFTGAGWQNPVIDLWFDETARWRLEIRDDDGRTVWSTSGRGTSATVTWNARVDGRAAPRGWYSAHVEATSVRSGARASDADHRFRLLLRPGEFDDVPDEHVFFDDIKWLSLQEITRGCNPPANTRFCPGSTVTRGQMAAFVSRAADLPAAAHAGFADVPRSHTFAKDIARLHAAGITAGCGTSPRRYCPDRPVTRQEMAAFLVRAKDLRTTKHPGFVDVRRRNPFRPDIRKLATAAVTRGCNPPTNTRFCPRDRVTRGQMAAFLRRIDL